MSRGALPRPPLSEAMPVVNTLVRDLLPTIWFALTRIAGYNPAFCHSRSFELASYFQGASRRSVRAIGARRKWPRRANLVKFTRPAADRHKALTLCQRNLRTHRWP
jgi:hypothetical protein